MSAPRSDGARPPLVEASGLTVRFDDQVVLRDLEMCLARGEHTVVFGPSGSGKSTLLYVMGGLLRPTAGRVQFEGADLETLGDPREFRRRHVGFVFQEFHLLESLTVFQNIDMVARGSGRVDLDLAGLLEPLGLLERLGDPVKVLSRGERQRVSIARAFASRPDLVLADEPTASLDPSNRERTMEHIFHLCELTGATALIVSHDRALQEFPQLTQSLRLEDGRLHSSDRNSSLDDAPSSEATP